MDVICCMTSYSAVREENIDKKMFNIHKQMGISSTYIAPYSASVFDNIPHLEKVQFIEDAIIKSNCNIVITHSNDDLHKDHVEVSELTLEAVRYYQRNPDQYKDNVIKKVLMMEIPCASLWSEKRFSPNAFVEIDQNSILEKIRLVDIYDNVIRSNPHPRSSDNILALAKIRGAMCGCMYAEAFKIVFELEN